MRDYDDFRRDGLPYKTEALINGKVVEYDGCGSGTLEDSKAFYAKYPGWTYIGSGLIYAIDGTRQRGRQIHHFFTRSKGRAK